LSITDVKPFDPTTATQGEVRLNGEDLDLSRDTAEAASLLNDVIYREPPVDPVEAALAALVGAAGPDEVEIPLRQLKDALLGAHPLRQATVRESAIAALRGKVGGPAHLVDVAIGGERLPASGQRSTSVQGREAVFADPEPWPAPVDGSDLLHDSKLRSRDTWRSRRTLRQRWRSGLCTRTRSTPPMFRRFSP
jgi:hypothetical protein